MHVLFHLQRKRPSSTAGLREGVGNGSNIHLMPVSHKKKRMNKRKSSDRSPLAIDSVGDSSSDANNSPAVVDSLRILVAEDVCRGPHRRNGSLMWPSLDFFFKFLKKLEARRHYC
jgi:hypothetical protein